VQSAGLLTTIQDLGRQGFGPLGVSASGAADPVSLRLGNRLVGNPENAPALEMTLLGGTFLFSERAIFALSGSEFDATLDGLPQPFWCCCEAQPGQVLRVGATRSGARCYLCVQGGFAVEPFLGSASTHLLSGLGGHQGRALKRKDVLYLESSSTPFHQKFITRTALQRLQPRKVLRVTPGPQSDAFPSASIKTFYTSSYAVAEDSNRMGLRLTGPSITQKSPGEMISEGVSLGAIQIAAGGQPIILFVEQQTTGGYAKIANVISADIHSIGQLRPRDEIRFELVGWDTARELLLEQEKFLASPNLFES